MLGAIIGDIAGSRFEFSNIKTKNFELFDKRSRFTDDSVMTAAVAKAILECDGNYENLAANTVKYMQFYGRRHPHAGYGGRFRRWLYEEDPQPYMSWGNGSAMRVSPCGFAADSLEEAEKLAEITASVTHNHPDGIKGAKAAAAAIFLAKCGKSIEEIRSYITENYYAIDFTLDEIRPGYEFNVSCQGSVPQALEAFFESESFEDTIRNAVSIGGDSDTIAAIAGGIAEAYYGIPEDIKTAAKGFLSEDLAGTAEKFDSRFGKPEKERTGMTEQEKIDRGVLFSPADKDLKAIKLKAHNLNIDFNKLHEDCTEERNAILKKLIGSLGEGSFLQGPITFHYGCHTSIGSHCFINFNFTVQDDAGVTIGDNCNFGPNVTIVTPCHPMIAEERNSLLCSDGKERRLCYAKPVSIGENCWFGANVVVCPGVTIGNNCVIGAGSVVTRDVPDNSFAAGNPCRIIREITEKDSVRNKPEIWGEYLG